MKKILSLVLAVVMIMAMAIPAFAATADEVAPYAVCTGAHTPGTFQSSSFDYVADGSDCNRVRISIYECSVCHRLYDDTKVIATYTHDPKMTDSSCNGTTQTVKWNCSRCGVFIKYTHPNCPNAGHTGNCLWLPV